MRLISEGAEAKIFAAKLLGVDAVVKRRVMKAYRVEQLDRTIRSSRTKTEARVLALVAANGVNAPKVLLVDGFDLYMTKITGKRPNGLTASQAVEAGTLLGRLHNTDIAHGDFTPANMLLCKGHLYVIDFGLAEISKSIEEKALDLLLMKRSIDQRAFKAFIEAYSKASAHRTDTIGRLAEIEKRGRYQLRTLS